MLQRPLDRCSPQRLSGVLPRPRIKRELAWNRPAKSFPEAGLTHTVLTHETVLFPGFALHLVLHRHASPPPGVFIVSLLRGFGFRVSSRCRVWCSRWGVRVGWWVWFWGWGGWSGEGGGVPRDWCGGAQPRATRSSRCRRRCRRRSPWTLPAAERCCRTRCCRTRWNPPDPLPRPSL